MGQEDVTPRSILEGQGFAVSSITKILDSMGHYSDKVSALWDMVRLTPVDMIAKELGFNFVERALWMSLAEVAVGKASGSGGTSTGVVGAMGGTAASGSGGGVGSEAEAMAGRIPVHISAMLRNVMNDALKGENIETWSEFKAAKPRAVALLLDIGAKAEPPLSAATVCLAMSNKFRNRKKHLKQKAKAKGSETTAATEHTRTRGGDREGVTEAGASTTPNL